MKNAAITLASIAIVLGIISFFVVFYSGGNYVVSNSPLGTSTAYPSSTSSTPPLLVLSSTPMTDVSSTDNGSSSPQSFSSDYSSPPLTWTEGNEIMAITGAMLNGSQLTFKLQIAMGSVAECVPLNIRLVADEKGDLTPPTTSQFNFPESGNCEGSPGEVYTDQEVSFTVDPTTLPLLFTTGGTSNMFFNVATDTGNSIDIILPSHSG